MKNITFEKLVELLTKNPNIFVLNCKRLNNQIEVKNFYMKVSFWTGCIEFSEYEEFYAFNKEENERNSTFKSLTFKNGVFSLILTTNELIEISIDFQILTPLKKFS